MDFFLYFDINGSFFKVKIDIFIIIKIIVRIMKYINFGFMFLSIDVSSVKFE